MDHVSHTVGPPEDLLRIIRVHNTNLYPSHSSSCLKRRESLDMIFIAKERKTFWVGTDASRSGFGVRMDQLDLRL